MQLGDHPVGGLEALYQAVKAALTAAGIVSAAAAAGKLGEVGPEPRRPEVVNILLDGQLVLTLDPDVNDIFGTGVPWQP
jgi:hypothetical protein